MSVTFKKTVPEDEIQQIQKVITNNNNNLLIPLLLHHDEVGRMDQQQYKKYRQQFDVMYGILKKIQKWELQRIFFSCRYCPKPNEIILKKISHIQFKNLKSLDFSRMGIQNIQPLTWILCQNLTQLSMAGNCVYNIKPLAKLSFKQLQQLGLKQYNDNNLKYLTRLKQGHSFIELQCYDKYIKDDTKGIDNYNNLFKMQSSMIINTILNAKFNNTKLFNAMKQKYVYADCPIKLSRQQQIQHRYMLINNVFIRINQ